jgi:hypothetical protein
MSARERDSLKRFAESCGESWACCGELVASGGLLRLRRASFGAKNRIDESA